MLVLVELAAKDATAAADACRLVDDYLESLLGAGLLRFRVARDVADARRVALIEEWTAAAAHEATVGAASFAALQRALAPLLAGAPRSASYEVVAAGVADDD